MKLTKTQKIMILIGISSILVTLMIPLISGMFSSDVSTGKRVSCETTIKNPVLTDNYNFERIECITKPSLLCELPLSISMFALRQADTVKVQIQANNLLAKSKTVTIEEGIVSGTLKDVSISYCVPKNIDKVKLRILDENNEETDSREVNI